MFILKLISAGVHRNDRRMADVPGRLADFFERAQHGALLREATLGFLLTDDERFAGSGTLRFDRALVPLDLPPDEIAPLVNVERAFDMPSIALPAYGERPSSRPDSRPGDSRRSARRA